MLKVAFLMPGEILNHQSLKNSILRGYSAANEVLEEASELLSFDIKKYFKEEDLDKLINLPNMQPLILALSTASFMVCKESFEIEPAYGAGYSLGEITALTCSGMITFKDAIRIAQARQRLIEETLSSDYHGMILTGGGNISYIQSIYEELQLRDMGIYITNYNSPNEVVFIGEISALQKAIKKFEKLKVKIKLFKVKSPLYTPLVDKVAKEFKKELLKYKFSDGSFPVISTASTLLYDGKASIVENLTKQITEPVKWTGIMKYLENERVKKAVMVTPSSFIKDIFGNHYKMRGLSFDNSSDLFLIKNIKEEIKMKSLIPVTGKALGIISCTKNSNFNEGEYKDGVIGPYKIIEGINERLESEGRYPNREEMLEVVNLMKLIFKTKKLPIEDQIERFQELIKESEINKELENIIMGNWA